MVYVQSAGKRITATEAGSGIEKCGTVEELEVQVAQRAGNCSERMDVPEKESQGAGRRRVDEHCVS